MLRLFDDIGHACQRAATERPLCCFDVQRDGTACSSVFLLRVVLQEPHADIRRYRVEAATVNDTCAGLCRALLVRIDHLSNPLHLAGEITIVCTRLDAGSNQFRAV